MRRDAAGTNQKTGCQTVHRQASGFLGPTSFSGRELVLAYAAQRTLKVTGQVVPFCAGSNAVIRITHSLVVLVAADTANVFHKQKLLSLFIDLFSINQMQEA